MEALVEVDTSCGDRRISSPQSTQLKTNQRRLLLKQCFFCSFHLMEELHVDEGLDLRRS